MTTHSPTQPTVSSNEKNESSTTSRTTNATEHYSRQSNKNPEPRTKVTRSKDSHRGITICRRVAPGRVARPTQVIESPLLIFVVIFLWWSGC